jgi:hypothetical protein
MKSTIEKAFNPSSTEANEFLKVILEKMNSSETTIRENAETVRKLSDTPEILQELGKRMGEQEKRLGELKGGMGEVRADFSKMAEKMAIPSDTISKLRVELERHVEFFGEPRRKDVHYRHFLGKPLVALIVAILVINVLVVLLIQSYRKAGLQDVNDIKWRYVKLSADTLFLHALTTAEDVFNANPDQFRKDVIDEEDRRQRLFEKWNQENETQKQIKELEGRKKLR